MNFKNIPLAIVAGRAHLRRKEIIQKYLAGKTLREIALAENISVSGVYRIIKCAGVARPRKPPKALSIWDNEKIFQLRILWGEGHSSQKIGNFLGFSKNSVIGKVHRLGLPKRFSPVKRKPIFPKPPKLADIQPGQCLWPEGDINDEEFYFCGQPVAMNRPYCEPHCRRAYRQSATP